MREGQHKRRTNPVVMGCMLPVLAWLAFSAVALTSGGIERMTDRAVVLLPERLVEAMAAVMFNFVLWGWAPYLLLWGLAVAASKGAKALDRCGRATTGDVAGAGQPSGLRQPDALPAWEAPGGGLPPA